MSHSARSSRSHGPVDEIGIYPIRRSGASRQVASLSDKSSSSSEVVPEIGVHPIHTSESRQVEVTPSTNKVSEVSRFAQLASSASSRQIEEVKAPEAIEVDSTSVLAPTSLNPLILSDNLIRYNHRLRVSYRTPIIFGSRSRAPQAGLKGYRPTHFYFDPVGGSLTSGTDVDLGWNTLGANSLITGLGNQATAPTSLVSGSYNKIFDLNKSGVGGNAIVGGVRNTLQYGYQVEKGRSGSVIIGSSGVFAQNCSNSVFLGLRLAPEVAPFDGLDNTTVVQDLQILGKARVEGDIRTDASVYCADIYALGTPNQGQVKAAAAVGGRIYAKALDVQTAQVTGDIFTTNIFAGTPNQKARIAAAAGGFYGQILDVKEAKAELAVYGGDIYATGPPVLNPSGSAAASGTFYGNTLDVKEAKAELAVYGGDIYATGSRRKQNGENEKLEGGFYGKTLNVDVSTIGSKVTPTLVLIDSEWIIDGGNPGTYDAAPLTQDVSIVLNSKRAGFLNGQTINIKDITQVFQPTTSFNVLISVNNDAYIETYDAVGQLRLVQNGTYILSTIGGAVSFRYVDAAVLGGNPSWVITNQFSGRDRQPI